MILAQSRLAVTNSASIAYLWIFVLVGALSIIGSMWAGFRLVNKHLVRPLRTLTGVEQAPGVLAVPSLVEQVTQLRETQVAQGVVLNTQTLQLSNLQAEVSPNGGKSLRDAISRVEQKMDALTVRVGELESTR